MKRTLLVLVALLALPTAAHADGLPVLGLDGNAGVVSSDAAYRYVTFPSGRQTVVARLRTHGGAVARYRTVAGRFTIPAVAYDNSASGLSQDGRTLVLIRPRVRMAQKHTHLLVLDAHRFRRPREIVLPGDFSFDAISPDGSTLFLVNYLSLTRHNFDPSDYKVRSFDVAGGKLDPAPVVDPRKPGEKMGGLPVTRAMSPDGRWAYTLYSGADHPFVHALDTVGNSARCIDLDALAKRDDLFQMTLRVGGAGDLQIVKANKPLLLVDTLSFAVHAPRAAAPAAAHAAPSPGDDGYPAWAYGLAFLTLLLVAAVSARPLARAARAR
jgi:hypothetical protein